MSDPKGGRKNDSGKPAMELIPPVVFRALGTVLGFGAKKYHGHNWAGADPDGTPHPERGLARSRVYAAILRHLVARAEGEFLDHDSGHPHTWHALTELAFLVAMDEYNIGPDDFFAWKAQRAVVVESLCAGVIPGTFMACGEGGHYCSDRCWQAAGSPPLAPVEYKAGRGDL